jgi:hypothetical protein
MTDTWDCQEARVALGVYVLGAIDPAERALVDAHLATCEACRAELAEFADLPALLALVPAGEAIALAEGLSADDLFAGDGLVADDLFPGQRGYPGLDLVPGPLPALPPLRQLAASTPGLPPAAAGAELDGGGHQLAQVHDLSAARHRRQRLAWAGAAAAVILIGAAFFGGTRLAGPASGQAASSSRGGLAAQHPNGASNGPLLTVHGSNGQATATIAYQSMGWGIQLDALVTGIPLHTHCQVWVVENDGTRVQAGGWNTDAAEGTVWYPASAFVPASDVRAFVVTLATGQQISVKPA